jgi:hypothetical protein
MMNELINGWCSRDLNAAAVYTMSHLEQVGSVGPTAVALSMFTTDPRRAGDWVRTLPAGEAKMIAEQNLGANWAQRDAPAAAHWVEDLPPEEQSQAVDSVVGRWVMNDRPAAVAWVGGLSGNMRDQAVRSVITTGQLAPDESLPLALSVSDPAQREELTQNVVIDWARTQPDLAAAWVRASGLPDQQKRTLLAQEIFFSPERYEPVIR